ncbi:MAG: SH3 domain-containing protein [Chromatiales bacterium]|jgi:hypothetical protein|nr:SH3 domain-containing protein [Chromatiales bacterium]
MRFAPHQLVVWLRVLWHRSWVVALFACGLTIAYVPMQATAAEQLLNDAVTAYQRGQSIEDRDARLAAFKRSSDLFMAAVARGNNNEELLANAGTAALQAERLGTAIKYLRMALLADPTHVRAENNLSEARNLLPAWVPRPKPNQLLADFGIPEIGLTEEQVELLAALLFAVGCILLSLALVRRAGAAGLFAVLAFSACIGSVLFFARGSNAFAVVTGEAFARAADSQNAQPRYPQPLPSGTEVVVLEERNAWTKIQLADGQSAWIRSSAIEHIRLPSQ